MKLFLPKDTITIDKVSAYSYGISELESFEKSTNFHAKLDPNEHRLFYIVVFFIRQNKTNGRTIEVEIELSSP